MSVMSLRLKDKDFKRINELSEMEHTDKSTVARKLIDYGWTYLMIMLYRDGKLSLSTLASKNEITQSNYHPLRLTKNATRSLNSLTLNLSI